MKFCISKGMLIKGQEYIQFVGFITGKLQATINSLSAKTFFSK